MKKKGNGAEPPPITLSALIGKCHGTIRARGLLSTRYVVAACVPCADVCGTPKRGKLKVYVDAAALIGNVDGGWGGASICNYTLAGGLKATIGVQRGKNAVELGYTGFYNNLSTTVAAQFGGPNELVSYNALDANFVKTLDRNPNLKVFVGVGYANLSHSYEILGARFLSLSNDMLGFHVGGKWSRSFGRLGFETYGKLGVYANTVTMWLNPNPFGWQYSQNSQGTYAMNGGFNVTYKLTRRMSSFVGYDMTSLTGVERGQALPFGPRNIADDGALIQGFVFGVKAAF